MSPLLFLLAIEIFNIKIRNSNVKGIVFCDEEIKILAYADDITAILPSINDAKFLLHHLDEFRAVSGLQTNKEKCEGLWLGKYRNCKEKPLGIKWQGFLKILGIYISYDSQISPDRNFIEKIETLKTTINMWKRRHLTLPGKILVIKTFGISQILYLCSVFSIPDWAKKQINKIIFEFLWNCKQNKVKANVVIQNLDQGGYKVPDINIMSKVQQLKWVKRYLENTNASWKSVFQSLMKPIDIKCFVNSSFSKKEIPTGSDFYKEILETLLEYKKIPDSSNDICNEVIWYNRYITQKGNTLYSKSVKEAGIIRIHQIIDSEGNLLPFDKLPPAVLSQTNFLFWNGLLKSIPKKWVAKLKGEIYTVDLPVIPLDINIDENDLTKLNFKLLYNALVQLKCEKSQAVINYSDKYDISEDTWREIYQLPHKVKLNNTLKEFQYKITHGYLATNLLLYKMRIIDSPRCNFCNLYQQSMSHLFFECMPVRSIWYQIEKKILNVTNRLISFKEHDILFGIPFDEDNFYNMVNIVIYHTKFYLYKCKLNSNDIIYEKLLAYIISRGKLIGW